MTTGIKLFGNCSCEDLLDMLQKDLEMFFDEGHIVDYDNIDASLAVVDELKERLRSVVYLQQ